MFKKITMIGICALLGLIGCGGLSEGEEQQLDYVRQFTEHEMLLNHPGCNAFEVQIKYEEKSNCEFNFFVFMFCSERMEVVEAGPLGLEDERTKVKVYPYVDGYCSELNLDLLGESTWTWDGPIYWTKLHR